jgi:large subunit ribosomal protein L24
MKIKKGDLVQVIAGKDKGKQGTVIQCFPKLNKVVVEGANQLVKHLRPQQGGEKGQRVEFFAPIHVSNVQVVCPQEKKATRVGFTRLEDGSKKRVSKKSGEIID